ncbi:hypothetical protein CapIbe_003709 [Capra ibex]
MLCDDLKSQSSEDSDERKLKEAKKILMDEMLCTYGMESCAVLSQKAASEECIMAAASQGERNSWGG